MAGTKIPTTVDGFDFPSVVAAARTYGFAVPGRFKKRLAEARTGGITLAEHLAAVQLVFRCDGVPFVNKYELARHLQVAYTTLKRLEAEFGNMSQAVDAIQLANEVRTPQLRLKKRDGMRQGIHQSNQVSKQSSLLKAPKELTVFIGGKGFSGLYAAALAHGNSYHCVRNRIERGWPIDLAITTPSLPRGQRKQVPNGHAQRRTAA